MRCALKSSLVLDPFPHSVCDDALASRQLMLARYFWPDSRLLGEETPGYGYKLAHLHRPDHTAGFSILQRAFWARFVKRVCTPLAEELARLYSPWIAAKFGPIDTAEFVTVALTEFDNAGTSVGCHVHRHDPLWLFTALIHIEDGGDERGNALFGFPGATYDDTFCATLANHAPAAAIDGLRLVTECGFKPGRLFSFFETPISYHGTRPPEEWTNPKGRRRMIRMHVRLPETDTQRFYGMSHDEYFRLQYPKEGADPRVAPFLMRDIELMRAPVETTLNIRIAPPRP